ASNMYGLCAGMDDLLEDDLRGLPGVATPAARCRSVLAGQHDRNLPRGLGLEFAEGWTAGLGAWRRSGQQFLDRGFQAGQRLAIEPGAIGDPRHAQFTELGHGWASGPGVAIDRPWHVGDQGGDVLLVADADRVDAVGPGRQVEATSAYRLGNPLLLGHPGRWQEGVGARVDDDRDPGVVCGGPDCR